MWPRLPRRPELKRLRVHQMTIGRLHQRQHWSRSLMKVSSRTYDPDGMRSKRALWTNRADRCRKQTSWLRRLCSGSQKFFPPSEKPWSGNGRAEIERTYRLRTSEWLSDGIALSSIGCFPYRPPASRTISNQFVLRASDPVWIA